MIDVDAAAVLGAALAEEALEVDVRLVVASRAAAERKDEQKRGGDPPHRSAAPAIARTICFWKTI
ncbi:MAG TPA: hypothetical protein VLI90_04295 [Tepidisphaeraceae bacterium]|nr:hypothetical protein [Tepidisphaeraceae bacterium]